MDALLVTCLLSACIVALGAAWLIGHTVTERFLVIASTITAGAVLLFSLLALA